METKDCCGTLWAGKIAQGRKVEWWNSWEFSAFFLFKSLDEMDLTYIDLYNGMQKNMPCFRMANRDHQLIPTRWFKQSWTRVVGSWRSWRMQ